MPPPGAAARITGPELDDLALPGGGRRAAGDPAKLGQFRGESRFTTWAYKFVIFEVSTKIGRHFWRNPTCRWTPRTGTGCRTGSASTRPGSPSGASWLAACAGRWTSDLTDRQRPVFVAIVVNAVPLDALVVELGSNRNAIYKTMFDARRKFRAALVANGYLDDDTFEALMNGRSALRPFLQTDPRDVGCAEAMELLHVYVELVAADAAAAERYPGIAAHLRACGPCAEDFDGLLAAVGTGGVDRRKTLTPWGANRG